MPHYSLARFLFVAGIFWASLYIYVPILAPHAQNLGASMGLVGIVVSAYGFPQLLLRIPIGVWSDQVGARKPFILAGIIAAALSGLGLAVSPDPWWLVVFRGISGLAAGSWVVFTVFFASYFPPERVTRAMSLVTFVGAFSEMFATSAGGVIAEIWGWAAPFYVGGGLALLGLAVALTLEEKPLSTRREITPRELIRTGTTPLLLVVSLIAMLTTWTQWVTVYGFTPVYAVGLGATRTDLGTLTAVMQLGYTMFSLLTGYAADWCGARATVIAGLIIQTAGAVMVPGVSSLWLIGLSQFLGGAGRGLSRPVLMGMSIRSVSSAERATAMGVFQAVYALGMFVGPATAGFLAEALGFPSIFLIAGLVTLVAIPMVLTKVPRE